MKKLKLNFALLHQAEKILVLLDHSKTQSVLHLLEDCGQMKISEIEAGFNFSPEECLYIVTQLEKLELLKSTINYGDKYYDINQAKFAAVNKFISALEKIFLFALVFLI